MRKAKEDFDLKPCTKECALCFINYTDALLQNSLFAGLERREVGRLIRNVHHQVRRLQKNEILASEGETLYSFLVIVEGTIIGEMMDNEGNMLTVEKRSAPQSVATAFIFGQKNKLPVTITATEATTLLIIPREELLSMFNLSKTVMKNFLDTISNRAQFLGERIKILSMKDLKGKLAFYLMEVMKKNGRETFRILHSQQELAEMFGSTRPSIGRVIRELNQAKLIETNGKHFRILNKKRLSQLIT